MRTATQEIPLRRLAVALSIIVACSVSNCRCADSEPEPTGRPGESGPESEKPAYAVGFAINQRITVPIASGLAIRPDGLEWGVGGAETTIYSGLDQVAHYSFHSSDQFGFAPNGQLVGRAGLWDRTQELVTARVSTFAGQLPDNAAPSLFAYDETGEFLLAYARPDEHWVPDGQSQFAYLRIVGNEVIHVLDQNASVSEYSGFAITEHYLAGVGPGRFKIFDRADGQLIAEFERQPLYDLDASSDESMFAALGHNGNHCVVFTARWELSCWTDEVYEDPHPRHIRLHPTRRLLIATVGNRMRVWRADTQELLLTYKVAAGIRDLEFTADGQQLVVLTPRRGESEVYWLQVLGLEHVSMWGGESEP